MDNQHKHIQGYRDLTQDEIDAMNRVKAQAAAVGDLIEALKKQSGIDQRWVAIGATDLQKGFMALVRSVARPTSF